MMTMMILVFVGSTDLTVMIESVGLINWVYSADWIGLMWTLVIAEVLW